jgi:hypothetical protein
MNVEKLFRALEEADTTKHILCIICAELERQGYQVSVNDAKLTSGMFEQRTVSPELLNETEMDVTISKPGEDSQSFRIEFSGFHAITISKK